MWRMFAELLVLVVLAFTVGAVVAAVALRVLVKGKAAADSPERTDAGTPGGAA